jgi:hypothetical protein
VAYVGKRRRRRSLEWASARSPRPDSAKRAGTSLPLRPLTEFRNAKTIVEGLPLERLSDQMASWSCSHFSPLETYPKDNSLNWQNGHKSRLRSHPESVAGADLLGSRSAILGAGILTAVGNMGNDSLGTEAWLKCQAIGTCRSAQHSRLPSVNTGNTLEHYCLASGLR